MPMLIAFKIKLKVVQKHDFFFNNSHFLCILSNYFLRLMSLKIVKKSILILSLPSPSLKKQSLPFCIFKGYKLKLKFICLILWKYQKQDKLFNLINYKITILSQSEFGKTKMRTRFFIIIFSTSSLLIWFTFFVCFIEYLLY